MTIRSHHPLPLVALLILPAGLVAEPPSAAQASVEQRASLRVAFAAQDLNGDGVLSRREYLAFGHDPGWFEAADRDGNHLLNQAEYVNAGPGDGWVVDPGGIDDGWITARVKASLTTEGLLTGARIHVDTSGGVVHLSGRVATRAQAARAAFLAGGVMGVRSVRNELTIDG